MNRKSSKIGQYAKWMMGALALAVVSVCHAGTALVGGGATMPAYGYAGFSSSNPIYPAGSGSLFGEFTLLAGGPSVSYCETGDGDAMNLLAKAPGFSVQNSCTSTGGIYHGLDAAGAGRTDLLQPNYISSAYGMSQANFSAYIAGHASGAYPTQFPALVGAIAIAFNLVDSSGTEVVASEVNFSDAQLCEIFSGNVTNWNDASLASAFTLPTGHAIPSTPINVQYRADATGTTLSLSNHLVNVCASVITNGHFVIDQAFTNVVANVLPAIPSNWTASSGNRALATAVESIAGSIGYVETNNAMALNPSMQFADVNGSSPLTNFGSPLTITSADLVFNKAVGADGTVSTLSPAPTTQCIALVPPADYAVAGVGGSILPSGTYPIVSVLYLLGNADGNGADLTSTRGLLESPYNATLRSSVTMIGPGTGLAFLTLGRGAFTAAQVGTCLVN
ncbi:substrate-binding domain-containing protein [Dyella acidiphila]|uniref:Substrate-binding domain-containing protein n=1 Tax=Dyella acidiphila TaxID=2775866 RepID=A0ABR9GED5_9GAMM|nr:substrate-binding domain-containing protein [Dyella acidiphila]MBE1162406.1 substrate-binding domain-containing protein [Dyella acidiphila]